MRGRDIVVGLIFLVLIILGIIWVRRTRQEKQVALPTPTPNIQEQISKTFNGLVLPEDTEKAELKDVSGGDGVGIATETEVLVDLPDLTEGYFYQVWVEKDGKLVPLGKMRVAKGGYLFEGKIEGPKVIVSKEKVLDNNIEIKVLEGSF